MKPAPVDGGTVTPTTVAPVTYVIPKIKGDPAAIYRLATAYRELADAVEVTHRHTSQVIASLSGAWRGSGHRAIEAPVHAFSRNAAMMVRALRTVADELDTYARKLAKAQHHHGLSLHKVLVVGAIVAVSAVAIVVTVGAAGAVEAGVAAAAVGGATEAAGAATAADLAAVGGIDEALDALTVMRPLLSFVLPHLIQAEWAAGALAAYDEATTGRIDWHAVEVTAGTAFLASGAAAKATGVATGASGAVAESGWLPHLIQGTAWSAAAGVDDEVLEGKLSIPDLAESFVLAGGGNLARDALKEHGLWLAAPDYRRAAMVALLRQDVGRITDKELAHEMALLRQHPHELQRGDVDLHLNEGPGHTLDRHVSKSAGDLLERVRTTKVRVASTYWDEASARTAIADTLKGNAGRIKAWTAAGSHGTLRLRLKVPYDVGFAIDRTGTVRFVREATVVLRRDNAGVVLVTSYPKGR